MSETETAERRTGIKTKLLDQLHDPVRLRVCVIAAVLAAGYVAVYSPLQARISDTSIKLKRDKKLLSLATGLEEMEKEHEKIKDRIPQHTDSKEWVQYVLDGIRLFPLDLIKLDCGDPKRVGPYQVVVMKIDLGGSFYDTDKFIRWLESNKRLLWVDNISISPMPRGGENYGVVKLTIIGLSG